MGTVPIAASGRRSLAPLIIGGIALIMLIAGLLFLNRPLPVESGNVEASPEAKAYVKNLALSDMEMKAAENFMQQQVVEIVGKITNQGPRRLVSVELTCIFHSADGHEIYRERVPIVRASATPFGSGQTRAFRLPFDTIPDGWNQAMPNLVIARIVFAQ
jgi:hypothetical protein